MTKIPVITVDGTTGSGKGTVGLLLAKKLGWHFLDSGAIYRALAWVALQKNIAATDHGALRDLALNLKVEFKVGTNGIWVTYLNSDITQAIRQENCGMLASQIASLAMVREALLICQRNFRQPPGLVADGRDMGTVVFPDAKLKIFLDAEAKIRALRRQKQLQINGIDGNFPRILHDLIARDEKDAQRAIAPLKPASDAVIIDTTHLEIDEVVQKILGKAINN